MGHGQGWVRVVAAALVKTTRGMDLASFRLVGYILIRK